MLYDSNGPKSYLYVYDDENQLIELRTGEYYTPSGFRFKTVWTSDGPGRARVRTDPTWPGSAWEVFLHGMSGTRGSGSLPRQVRRAARVLTEHSFNHNDGMRVIQERNSSNTPTVVYTRGKDLSGSLEGAGGIGGLLGQSHGWYSGGTYTTHNHYHADGNGNLSLCLGALKGCRWVRRTTTEVGMGRGRGGREGDGGAGSRLGKEE